MNLLGAPAQLQSTQKPGFWQEPGFSASPHSLLPALFAVEQHYGWSVGMRAVTHSLLDGLDLPAGAVVDLGCGGGTLLAELREPFPNRMLIGLDRHPLAVASLHADLASLPLAGESVALLLALDSLDQAGVDLPVALSESRRVMIDGGTLLLRVSAGPRLYGPHDVAFNTGCRYDRTSLIDALVQAGFRIRRCTYANLLMGMPVMILRLLQRARFISFSTPLGAGPAANQLMRALLVAEARYLTRRNLPIGLSLYVLACKRR